MWRRIQGEQSGFGVRFVALDANAQRRLSRFVEEHAAVA
jgi:hypothetical protein